VSSALPPQPPGDPPPERDSAARPPAAWAPLAAPAEARRRSLRAAAAALQSELPLRFWRQQAHLTVPASDYERVEKAVTRALGAVPRLLEQHGITVEGTATALGVGTADVEAVLAPKALAPLVLVDAEDAQAPGAAVVARSRANAVRAFTSLRWGDTLRFYRPSGLDQEACVGDLLTVLGESGQGRAPENFPVDGITWAKVRHPDEIGWVVETLQALERSLGLPANRLRLQFLVESGWAVARLGELVQAAGPRLCGIVFGIADYSADLGLTRIRNSHPTCDWARAAIVNAAGAAGVPAIDAMTMNYPAPDPERDSAANRRHILDRVRECFEDTLHGVQMGMMGKWAGHPLQLFAVLLAHRMSFARADLERDIHAVEAYATALAAERGTALVAGAMSDRATDRQRRTRLRRAVALGHLEPARGVALGVVSPNEISSLQH